MKGKQQQQQSRIIVSSESNVKNRPESGHIHLCCCIYCDGLH